MSYNVTLRPITADDQEFLSGLYASTRQEEMALVDWPAEKKAEFLQMQFQAQHTFYMEQFKGAAFDLLVLNGQPIGRLYLDRRVDELRIIDIALLPEYRNQGLGSRLMQKILAEAEAAGLPVRIHVEHYNPARRLYQRLGFKEIETNGVYYLMEWTPQ
jgi:ribosomal protein S18 acetylase RimI-like enzyme